MINEANNGVELNSADQLLTLLSRIYLSCITSVNSTMPFKSSFSPDKQALGLPIWNHVYPHGTIRLNLKERLFIDAA